MVYLIHYVIDITRLKLRRQISDRHAQDRPGGEVKLSLNMDSRVRYEWTSAGGPLNFDTHGDPYDAPKVILLGESTSLAFWIAAALMSWGVWLHLTEHHEHEHAHEPIAHGHRHIHDAHHRHEHDFEWGDDDPHEHWHQHETMVHKHPHFPDIQHRHLHG